MISLSANNLFPPQRRSFTEADGPAFYQLQESWIFTRRIILSFNYRFGKVKPGDPGKTRGGNVK
ncbi:hypothetical protein [Longitalea luteola]|uniref:hypothetical protein n=1 Tax=Longitalea luteola TaxID=2812563 RepID=UPI001A95C03F|nr:hypothetical protein [Longitalea luteola]